MMGLFLFQLQFLSVAYRMKDCVRKSYSLKRILLIQFSDSVEILLSFRKSRALLIAINPSSCGILGYRSITYIVQSVTSSDKGGRSANLDKKSSISLMHDLTFWTKGLR